MSKDNSNYFPLNEGLYDFYDLIDSESKSSTIDKIQNYYFEKIKKFGKESLTKKEMEIFQNATMGKLKAEDPVYKRDKVTGDIALDKNGKPIRIDQEVIPAGVPFVTTKGRNRQTTDTKKEVIIARCYWNVDDPTKAYYVYSDSQKSSENPYGLIIWKSISKNPAEKPLGTFIVPKGEAQMNPEELWANLNDKFDKGIILDKETYYKFLAFDDFYHSKKKIAGQQLILLYDYLHKYPKK